MPNSASVDFPSLAPRWRLAAYAACALAGTAIVSPVVFALLPGKILWIVRVIAVVCMIVSGIFLFTISQTILRGQPIPWQIEFPGSVRRGVCERHSSPKTYWVAAMLNLVFALSMLCGSLWMLCKPARAARLWQRIPGEIRLWP
jgi:hypothetical protein